MVEYTTINPVYEEAKAMNKIVCYFILLMVLLI